MASKSKKRSKAGQLNPVDQVRRHLERGDFRQALKGARVAYRQDPSPECRCFLEHAYIGRAQQLAHNGLTEDCRRIVRDLLDLGVTEPTVQSAMPGLLLSVGLFDRLAERQDSLTDRERRQIRLQAADQAVTKPENTPKSMADLLGDARRVRAALEAVERGEDAAAIAQLKEIARQSLLADWKYFVRGLIGYYRHDRTEMLANWDRLDTDRAAAKIAAPLKVLAGAVPAGEDGILRAKVARLEKQGTSRMVLSEMGRLRESVHHEDWPQALKSLRSLRGELRSLDPGLDRRLVACICGMFMHKGLVGQVDRLGRIADPPPLDPRWNRAKAIACEFAEDDDGDSDPEEYWRKYLADLETVTVLAPAERDLARALVWLRLAGFPAHEAWRLRRCPCGYDHGPEIEEVEEEAREAFERSLTLAPGHAETYKAMARFHLQDGRIDEAAGVYRRMLRHLPDSLDALLFLGEQHVARDEPHKAREYADRAQALKPLDQDRIRDLAYAVHLGMARKLGLEGDFDRAREELAGADRLKPAAIEDYRVLARKAVLEIKAGGGLAARRLVEQARRTLSEPAPLWLAMAIEARRYELPKEETWLYEKRWQEALRRRCRSETAGRMCRLLGDFLAMPKSYPERAQHVAWLRGYVRRCTRVKWRADDLRDVCELLSQVESAGVRAEFARQGVRKFPQMAYFHLLAAEIEISRGPVQGDWQLAQDGLEKAIELASKSSDPRDKKTAETAARLLHLIETAPEDDCEDDWDDDSEDDWEDDDDDDDDDGDEYDGRAFDRSAFGDDLSAARLIEIIRRASARAGLDPKVIFDQLGIGKAGAGRARK
ncbi:MAG: tetratricopeptide repeat protein [Pirellulaceae bacterium]|jgi:tetratricopeptide (TPR) repeat protein|nr:tetratricopeptide repeat protein [Thermoguttaceae bacterium]MDI9445042.1 tetratricopeptide repeat protein [Planctomycetota bacterium]NLY98911.1 tetratricopeptide repeat protein [Pirellulaceae bacterium]